MKKHVLFYFLPLFIFFSPSAEAQEYSSAIGLRAGLGANLSYKKFVGSEAAFELIGGFNFGDLYASLVFEKHNRFANDIPGLTWYWGIGGSVVLEEGGVGIGGLGAVGLEYSFYDIPLNISIDWMPHLFLIGGRNFDARGGGLALRYILER